MSAGLVVGIAGVILWGVSKRLEISSDAPRTARLFKRIGIALAAVGFSGAAWLLVAG